MIQKEVHTHPTWSKIQPLVKLHFMKPLLPISTGNVSSQEAMGFAKRRQKGAKRPSKPEQIWRETPIPISSHPTSIFLILSVQMRCIYRYVKLCTVLCMLNHCIFERLYITDIYRYIWYRYCAYICFWLEMRIRKNGNFWVFWVNVPWFQPFCGMVSPWCVHFSERPNDDSHKRTKV